MHSQTFNAKLEFPTAPAGTSYCTCRHILLHLQALLTAPAVTSYCTSRDFLLHRQELPSDLLHLQGLPTFSTALAGISVCTCRHLQTLPTAIFENAEKRTLTSCIVIMPSIARLEKINNSISQVIIYEYQFEIYHK